jgi:Tfp pilus assembly protein PilN
MESDRTADRHELLPIVSQLIRQLSVAGVVALIAEITEPQTDYVLLSGEQQKATRCMHDVRVLQQTAHTLES